MESKYLFSTYDISVAQWSHKLGNFHRTVAVILVIGTHEKNGDFDGN